MGTVPQDHSAKLPITEKAAALAAGLRQLAGLIENLTDETLLDDYAYNLGEIIMPIHGKEELAAHIRAALAAGATVTKYFGTNHAGARLHFGPVVIQPYDNREAVCERVVTGTREVTKEVPDPEALASVPKVTVTETVEDVEWRCHPILDEAVAGAR